MIPPGGPTVSSSSAEKKIEVLISISSFNHASLYMENSFTVFSDFSDPLWKPLTHLTVPIVCTGYGSFIKNNSNIFDTPHAKVVIKQKGLN